MTTEKYYLKADHQTEWSEVTREQFISAEQAAGFRSKFGPNHPATGGFTGGGMRGRIEYVTEQPRPEQAAHDSARGYDQCQYRYSVGAACSIYRNCHPSGILNHDFVESPTPAAPERGEWWRISTSFTSEPERAVYAGDRYLFQTPDADWSTLNQIITEHNQHPTLIEQREWLLDAAKLLLAMDNCNYDRDVMRRSGGFKALQEAVEFATSTTTGREG